MVFYLYDLQKTKIFTLTLLFFALGAFVDNSGRNTHWFFYHPLKILVSYLCYNNTFWKYLYFKPTNLELGLSSFFTWTLVHCSQGWHFWTLILHLLYSSFTYFNVMGGGIAGNGILFFYDSKFSPENCKSLLNIVHMLWFGLTIYRI